MKFNNFLNVNYYYYLFFHYVYLPIIFFVVRLFLLKDKFFNVNRSLKQPVLHTLPYSHFCEKVRWALDLGKEDYIEKPHGLMTYAPFSLYHTKAASRQVPIIILKDNTTISDSTNILLYLFKNFPDKYKWLYPNEETKEIEEYLDSNLGTTVMGLIYPTLFASGNKKTLSYWKNNLYKNIPTWESLMSDVLIKDFKFIIETKKGPFGKDPSIFLQKLEDVFSYITELLKERTYLANTSHITAADITFASLSLPILCPAQMEHLYMKSSDFPQEFQKNIDNFRKTQAGQFALKLYEKERSKEETIKINTKNEKIYLAS